MLPSSDAVELYLGGDSKAADPRALIKKARAFIVRERRLSMQGTCQVCIVQIIVHINVPDGGTFHDELV